MKSKKIKLEKIRTLNDLFWKCSHHVDCRLYKKLAIKSAINLGCQPSNNFKEVLKSLNNIAVETGEDNIIKEINFCLEFIE